jgi:hypothetical protein
MVFHRRTQRVAGFTFTLIRMVCGMA